MVNNQEYKKAFIHPQCGNFYVIKNLKWRKLIKKQCSNDKTMGYVFILHSFNRKFILVRNISVSKIVGQFQRIIQHKFY